MEVTIILLIVVGAIISRVAIKHWDWHLSRLLTHVGKWRELLARTPGDGRLVHTSSDLWEVWHLPATRHVYVTTKGLRAGAAFRVYCPLGYVVRLPFRCSWSGRRCLDGSAFALRTDSSTSDAFIMMKRATRWQLYLSDSDKLKSKDNYFMNCHLAVHGRMVVDISNDDELAALFDNVTHYVDRIREFVVGFLRDRFGLLDYRPALYESSDIVRDLNRAWLDSARHKDIRACFEVSVTSMIIKPRKEAEMQFFADMNRSLKQLEERREAISRRREGLTVTLATTSEQLQQEVRRVLSRLADDVPQAVERNIKTIAGNLKNYRSSEALLESIAKPFPNEQLADEVRQAVEACSEVGSFLGSLDRRASETLDREGVPNED